MFYETIDNLHIADQIGTSEGTQEKYYYREYWYKKDSRGCEGLAEYLCSKLLTFSDLDEGDYILYEQGFINGIPGCRSKNFLSRDEQLFTFYRLYYNEFGKNISTVISTMDSMAERIEYVVQFIREICDLDITDYLRKVFTLDYIILNEDRHLNNLAVVYDGDHFKPAPIFDNGVSLLTCNQSVSRHLSVEENVKRVTARPFSGSHRKMAEYFGAGLNLDKAAAIEWLLTEPDSTEKEVLMYQLENMDFDW